MQRLLISVSPIAASKQVVSWLLGCFHDREYLRLTVDVEELEADSSYPVEMSKGHLLILPARHSRDSAPAAIVAAVPRRLLPTDLLIYSADHGARLLRELQRQRSLHDPKQPFAILPQRARLGVNDLSAAALVRWFRSDLDVAVVAESAPTALAPLNSGALDALVVDESLVDRDLLATRPHRVLHSPWITAPAHGAVMVLCSAEDEMLTSLLRTLEHRDSRLEVEAELQLQALLGSNHDLLLRAAAHREGDRLQLDGAVLVEAADGMFRARRNGEATRAGASRVARQVARDLLDQVARCR